MFMLVTSHCLVVIVLPFLTLILKLYYIMPDVVFRIWFYLLTIPSVREQVFYVLFSDFRKVTFYVFWNDVGLSKSLNKSQKVSSLLNVYRNFGLKTPGCYGYLQAFITHSSQLWLSSLWNYTYVFFQNPQKTWPFTFSESLHTFSWTLTIPL